MVTLVTSETIATYAAAAIAPQTRVRISNVSDFGCGRYMARHEMHVHLPIICAVVAYMVDIQWHTAIHSIVPRPMWQAEHNGSIPPGFSLTVYSDGFDETEDPDVIDFTHRHDFVNRDRGIYVNVNHAHGRNKRTGTPRMHPTCTGVIW